MEENWSDTISQQVSIKKVTLKFDLPTFQIYF